jgi:3'-phosphoadenosine 5'-phosphosulfate sulfotransferase (PAPS reductase)/FAD synthetase
MTHEQARAFRIADNKVAESDWLEDILAEELEDLHAAGIDLIETGFTMVELEKELPHLYMSDEKKAEALDEDTMEIDDPIFPSQGENELTPEELEMPMWEWVDSHKTIIVMFSGGKDSQAMLTALLNNGISKDKIVVAHMRVPLDHDDYDDFTEKFCKENDFKLEMIGHRMPFKETCRLMRKRGVPYSFTTRWCTRSFKVAPFGRWVIDAGYKNRKDVLIFQGWRAEESPERALARRRGWIRMYKMKICRPIMDWPTEKVFDEIAKMGWKVHPIYDKLPRLGCIYCFAIKRDEWTRIRNEAPDVFLKALRLVAEGFCADNMKGDTCKDILRKMMGLPTMDKIKKLDNPYKKEKKFKKGKKK